PTSKHLTSTTPASSTSTDRLTPDAYRGETSMLTAHRADRRTSAPGGRRGPRALVVALVTAMIATGIGGLATPAAAAPGPTITVTKAPAAGGTVTVVGAGFNADPAAKGVYVGIGAAGAGGFYAAGTTDTVWVAVTNTEG